MWNHIALERDGKELQAKELPKTWKHQTSNRNERETFEYETS